MFVVHIVVEPWAPSVCVDCVHLSGERLVELVRALIRLLCSEIYIRIGSMVAMILLFLSVLLKDRSG